MDTIAQQPTSVEFSGIVIRCGCTLEQRIEKNWHGYMNEVCPNPLVVEDLGVLAYRHKNVFKTMWWKIKKALHIA